MTAGKTVSVFLSLSHERTHARTHTRTHIHTHTHAPTHPHTHAYTDTHKRHSLTVQAHTIQLHTHTHTHAHTRTRTHTHTHTQTRTHTHAHTHTTHARTYTHLRRPSFSDKTPMWVVRHRRGFESSCLFARLHQWLILIISLSGDYYTREPPGQPVIETLF